MWAIVITLHPSSLAVVAAYVNSFFSETTRPNGTKFGRNVPWMVLTRIFVFFYRIVKFNMATPANNVFWLAGFSDIFLSETTEVIKLLYGMNDPYMVLYQTCDFFCRSEIQDGHHSIAWFNIEPYGRNM